MLTWLKGVMHSTGQGEGDWTVTLTGRCISFVFKWCTVVCTYYFVESSLFIPKEMLFRELSVHILPLTLGGVKLQLKRFVKTQLMLQ